MSAQVERELAQARELLLDLSLRNRLLNYRPTRRTSVPIVDELPDQVWRILVSQGKSMSFLAQEEHEQWDADSGRLPPTLLSPGPVYGSPGQFKPPSPDTALTQEERQMPGRHTDRFLQTQLSATDLQTNLLRTERSARSAIEEKGVNFLHLALGFVAWHRQDDLSRELLAPVMLLPVRLERRDARRRFSLRALDDDPVPNPCLAALLERNYSLGLPPMPSDWEDFDLKTYLAELSQTLGPLSGWQVNQGLALGLFSFSKYLMYLDLDPKRWPEQAPLTENPLIAGLCGRPAEKNLPDASPVPTDLDGIDPAQTFCVKDADASQLAAITAAAKGESFVVEGPPGTGKSQTITNMVSACLAAGKTVLFVSEKLAALEVVKRRLDQVGLGDFCLELHSTKANRKAVLAQIGQSIDQGRLADPPADGGDRSLAAVRDKLNGYVRALHTPLDPSGVTPHAALVHGLQLTAAAEVPVALPGLSDWDAARLDELTQSLKAFARSLEQVWPLSDHAFAGSGLTATSGLGLAAVRADLGEIGQVIEDLLAAAAQVASLLGAPESRRLSYLRELTGLAVHFADSPGVPSRLMTESFWENPSPECEELTKAVERCSELSTWAADRYRIGSLFDAQTDWRLIHKRYRTSWFSWFRVFRPAYWADRKRLRGACTKAHRPGFEQALDDLASLAEWQSARETVEQGHELGLRAFDRLWSGLDTDPTALRALSRWLTIARKALVTGKVGQAATALAVNGGPLVQLRTAGSRLDKAVQAWDEAFAGLMLSLKLEAQAAFSEPVEETDLDGLAERFTRMEKELESLHHWIRFQHDLQAMRQGPLSAFVSRALSEGLGPEQLPDSFEKLLFRSLVEQAEASRPELSGFSGPDREAARMSFAELDRAWLAQTSLRLQARLSRQRPVTGLGAAASSELGVLLGEIRRKRGGRSIRRVLADAGDLVQRCKPVFMMSPQSVAQFLTPGRCRFDLVVFDEASQVEPADALGAIARGSQLVLVGDSKQLPPTSFFRAVGADDHSSDQDSHAAASIADMESILDRGAMVLPHRRLRWHFRSRHDSLIAFSNRSFYENELVITPASVRRAEDLGLQVIYNPSDAYDRGKSQTNQQQAARIAAWVFEHARLHPDKSLGVGAFSQRQQVAIEDEVELLRLNDPSLESFFSTQNPEPFFVKNLETIQGDERDVIALSIGYGRREPGQRLSMNFGPLNQDGGWRRLNVLITRARERCVIFSSIRPEDFDLKATASRGVHALCDYLRFAFNGPDRPSDPKTQTASDGLASSVAKRLADKGLTVHHRVGLGGQPVELALPDPERAGSYLLGLELDGADYAAARTARDRDRLRQQVLEGLGWRIQRIWTQDWARTPEAETKRVIEAFEAARAGRLQPIFSRPSKPERQRDLEPMDLGPSAFGFTDYLRYKPERRAKPDDFQRCGRAELSDRIAAIVQVEGPICEDALMHRLAEVFGLSRAGSRVRKAARAAVARATGDGRISARDGYLWPADMDDPPVRRRSDAGLRDADLICSRELGQAAWQLLGVQGSMTREDLIAQTARALGFASAGSKLGPAISAAVDLEIGRERIASHQGRLETAKAAEPAPAPASQPSSAAPKNACPSCAHPLKAHHKFCPQCGERVNDPIR
jgi:hypothetical protein